MNGLIVGYKMRANAKNPKKAVFVVNGLSGSGKTSFALDYFKDEKLFYFSFLGLNEEIAELLFAEKVSEVVGEKVSGWGDSFTNVASHYKVIILDDLSSISSFNRFHTSFYKNMYPNKLSRPFIVLITQPTDNIAGLADRQERLELTYFNIREVMDIFPKLTKYSSLSVSAVSGGISEILQEFKPECSLEDNLRRMLNL